MWEKYSHKGVIFQDILGRFSNVILETQIKTEQLKTCTLLDNIIQLKSCVFFAQRKPCIGNSSTLVLNYGWYRYIRL